MANTLPISILDDFKKICKYNLSNYLNGILNFMQTDYIAIQSYYTGKANTVSTSSFKNLDNWLQQTATVLSLFDQFRRQMNNLKWWDLLEKIEDIDNRLNTLENINRWARASTSNVGYNPTIQIEHVLRQNETLERVAQDILGSNNPQDDWYNIAVNNDLIEEGYTEEGGVKLNLAIDNSFSTGFVINSVVDMISGETVYGKDVYRKLEFDETESDLVVLSYQDTIDQAIYILAKLKKNDNPDFPTSGLQRSVVIGATRASMNYPLINRQMSATFATDDSLKNFTINSTSIDQDNLTVNFTVYSRLGETMALTVQL